MKQPNEMTYRAVVCCVQTIRVMRSQVKVMLAKEVMTYQNGSNLLEKAR